MKLPTLFDGLKEGGTLILNTPRTPAEKPDAKITLGGVINATGIAVEEIGRDIPNTCLLGAFAAATGWLKLESLRNCLGEYLSGDILTRNLRSIERGYEEVEVIKW